MSIQSESCDTIGYSLVRCFFVFFQPLDHEGNRPVLVMAIDFFGETFEGGIIRFCLSFRSSPDIRLKTFHSRFIVYDDPVMESSSREDHGFFDALL